MVRRLLRRRRGKHPIGYHINDIRLQQMFLRVGRLIGRWHHVSAMSCAIACVNVGSTISFGRRVYFCLSIFWQR
jgi:hypothetical protein